MGLDDPNDPNEDGEPGFVVEPLRTDAPKLRRWLRPRTALNTLSVLAALLLIVTGSVMLLRHLRGAASSQRQTRQSRQIVAVTPGAGVPGEGWRSTGPVYAQVFAFAPSAPSDGYVCGVPNLVSLSAPLPIAVGALDARGGIWQSFPTPALGVACDLSVDPTDPYDVVLLAIPCLTCSDLPPMTLYRSRDGGIKWQQQFLPAYRADGARDFSGYQWAWSGSTFFFAPYVRGEQSYTRLAASGAGGPLSWVSQNGPLSGEPPGTSINQLIGGAQSLTVALDVADCSTDCIRYMRSSDDGASWHAYAPIANKQPIALLNASADGSILFGQIASTATRGGRSYLSSTDGGTTWLMLPAVPPGLAASRILASPDQTLYAELFADSAAPAGTVQGAQGIYRLGTVQGTFKSANPLAWLLAAPYPVRFGGPIAMTWDASGHPATLWADADVVIDGEIQQGVESHTP